MDTAVRSKRILILDDEAGVLELLDFYLRSCGFETHPTSRWTQAVELITHHPPDLVLLDLQMPTVQGDTILEFIQRQDRSIPVIIISGYLDERRIEALRRTGARGFVPKPFRLEALASVIREALGLSVGAAAPPSLKATPEARAEAPLSAPADLANGPFGDIPSAPPPPEVVEVPAAPVRADPPSQGRHRRHPHSHRRRRPRNLRLYVVVSLICLVGSLVVLLIEKLPAYFSSSLEQAVEKSIQSEAKRQMKGVENLSDKEKEALKKMMGKK